MFARLKSRVNLITILDVNTRGIWTSSPVNSLASASHPFKRDQGVDRNNYYGGIMKKWARVKYKGEDRVDAKIYKYKAKEHMISDPERAQNLSILKMESLYDKLMKKGFSRECKSYHPPSDVEWKIQTIYSEVINPDTSSYMTASFTSFTQKFEFLNRCYKEFEHEVPSSLIYRINKIEHVVDFYKTPVQGISPYGQLIRTQENLPANLYVIPDTIRFDPQTDTFFGGVDAYPGSTSRSFGLRGKKKYPDIKTTINWPDI